MLDRQIAAHGQILTLCRGDVSAVMRGVVRGYRPEQITDGITIGTRQVILSPTSLTGTPLEEATEWPRVGDFVEINARIRRVDAVDLIKIDDVLVRINMTVAG